MADTEFGTAYEVLLRAIGAFYALTAPLVLRQAALTSLLDRALGLLGASGPHEQRAENARTVILCANSVLIGIGGIWLAVLAQAAAWLFLAAAIFYGLYLAWLAPRWLDIHDPAEEPGRSQTRNAFYLYAGATALVLAGHAGGLLADATALGAASFWTATALSAGLAFYAVYLFLPAWEAGTAGNPVEGYDEAEPEVWTARAAQRAVLTPSWTMGGLVDAENGDPVTAIEGVELTDDDFRAIDAWNDLFRSLADPDDPLRAALREPDRQAEIEAAGRAVFETLLAKAGPDRITFEPVARPQPPLVFPAAVKVMADYGCSALWHDGGDAVGDIHCDDLGLSWSLACELGKWSLEFDEALDWNDPGGAARWTPAESAEHDRRGAALASQVAEELARTGRGHVAVRYVPRGEGAA